MAHIEVITSLGQTFLFPGSLAADIEASGALTINITDSRGGRVGEVAAFAPKHWQHWRRVDEDGA